MASCTVCSTCSAMTVPSMWEASSSLDGAPFWIRRLEVDLGLQDLVVEVLDRVVVVLGGGAGGGACSGLGHVGSFTGAASGAASPFDSDPFFCVSGGSPGAG